MLSSKYIQDLILKTPEIMRKIKYSFRADIDIAEIAKFFSEKGKYIRKIGITNFSDPDRNTVTNNPLLISYIANQAPNLEDFACEYHTCYDISENTIYNPFYMPRLKHLSLKDQLPNFITNAQNIVNLETLTLGYDLGYVKPVVDFLCQQKDLKELNFNDDSKLFKSRDISNDVKFNLTTLGCYDHYNQKSQNFINFLKRQAGSLEELNICGPLNLELFEIIFTKCKNLRKMFSCSFFDSPAFENVNSDWTLNNLRHFNGRNVILESKLNLVYAMFPNLVSLKCYELKIIEGTFDKLESLEVEYINCREIQNCKFPNLKNLSLCSVDFRWEQFARNIPKLEKFKLSEASDFSQFLILLKSLKYFNNIKNFVIINRYTENKVSINTNSKVVEISEIFFKDRQEILNILEENFKNCTFKQVLS